MIKLCIFDMDGLLIDSERHMWMVSMKKASDEQGFPMSDEFHKSLMGLNREDTINALKNAYGPTFDADKYFKRVKELNHIIINEGVPLMKGAKELLDFLKENNIKTCIGTSTSKDEAHNILVADNLIDYFDAVVCGDEIKNGKPAPDIYLKCFEKFNVDSSEALIFEDANPGALAALKTGIRLVLVPDLAFLSDDVKNKAYKVLNDLSEIIDTIRIENERTTGI